MLNDAWGKRALIIILTVRTNVPVWLNFSTIKAKTSWNPKSKIKNQESNH